MWTYHPRQGERSRSSRYRGGEVELNGVLECLSVPSPLGVVLRQFTVVLEHDCRTGGVHSTCLDGLGNLSCLFQCLFSGGPLVDGLTDPSLGPTIHTIGDDTVSALDGSYDGKLVPDSFRTLGVSQLGVGTGVQPRHDGCVDGVGRAFVGSFLVGITPVNPQQFPSQRVDGNTVRPA